MRAHRLVVVFGASCLATGVSAQGTPLPTWLHDRGPGQPVSMFATYIQKGELLVYPFMELYRDKDMEYKPAELGYGVDQDYRGRYRATESLIYLAYGFTNRLAVEIEAAMISARLDKAPDDPSTMPAMLKQSGTGDVEGQVRFRWTDETAGAPEVFSYFEAVSARNRDKPLIGTEAWEYKFGTGLMKGTSVGTFAVRAAMERSEGKVELGEYAAEYVKRLSPRFLVYTGFEGSQDELEWISELQVRIAPHAVVKLNNSFGMTSKATDWGPELGLMFSLPLAR